LSDFPDEIHVASPAELGYQAGSFEIYQLPEFAEIFSRHYHSEVKWLGDMLVYLRRRPLMGVTKAILGSPEVAYDCAGWLDRVRAVHAGELEVLTNQPCGQLSTAGGGRPDHHNFIIDLHHGHDVIWAGLKKRCRNAVRRGEKMGLVVREAHTVEELHGYYEVLMRVSGKGRKYAIPDFPLIRDVFAASFGRLFIAEIDAEIVGGLFYLANRHVYGWAAAFDVERARGAPSNLLYWEGIRWAAAEGYRVYDMGAQRIGDNPQLDLFKRSFSPILVPGYRYLLAQSAWKNRLMKFGARLKKRK
jgi:hypothetical protein